MSKTPLDIVVPIFNEGDRIINLFKEFDKNIKTSFRVLLCYDSQEDDVFNYSDKFDEFKFKIIMVKNPESGPSSAIKKGLIFGRV